MGLVQKVIDGFTKPKVVVRIETRKVREKSVELYVIRESELLGPVEERTFLEQAKASDYFASHYGRDLHPYRLRFELPHDREREFMLGVARYHMSH